MRIFLADLAHTHSLDDTSIPVPLGIGYIKAYADARLGPGVQIDLFKHPQEFLAAIHKTRPDIIGLANYGWNENLNRAVGQHIRSLLPNALIVAGGPNLDPGERERARFLSRHSYLDFAIVDGGEEPFADLVTWRSKSCRDRSELPRNLIWLENGVCKSTPERPLKKTIDGIPSPYLSGALDGFLNAGMIPMIETNRGCPFQCTFCAWGMASKDLVRRFDLDTPLAEIAYIGERSPARNWIICDANFGILKRDVDIAKAIRQVRDRHGRPEKCQLWLAKNVTERNLEIGAILNEMVVPVMAVQSMNADVLRSIKRDNISTSTYIAYQNKFHQMGSRTYSDVIVPLPGETLLTHLDGLRQLFSFGVDIITNHNMRLLAGAETNSLETRERYRFATRYRLIHGDAGVYVAPDGTELRCFEFEESLRSTDTMTEPEVFHLRKVHFLVDFFWNIDVYKPLLQMLKNYGINPLDVITRFIEATFSDANEAVSAFWRAFEEKSQSEWFDSAEEIEAYFSQPGNFARLIDQEFEKLNMSASVIALRDVKPQFDAHMLDIAKSFPGVPIAAIEAAMKLSSVAFPSLDVASSEIVLEMPGNWADLHSAPRYVPSWPGRSIRFVPSDHRERIRKLLTTPGRTLSKVLNTQGITLRDLRYVIREPAGQSSQP